MAGLVTLEDLIGDSRRHTGQYDTEVPEIQAEDENTYIVQFVNLEELSDALAYPFDTAFEDVDTRRMVPSFPEIFEAGQLITRRIGQPHVLEVRTTG